MAVKKINILVTGASGFTGLALVKILKGNITLLDKNTVLNNGKKINVVCCDLLDAEKVKAIIKRIKPDRIYHLAGSFTNEYDKDFNLNVIATKNILDAVSKFSISSRVLLIGSAAEYGLISKDLCPVKETAALRPFNVYGLTKIHQKFLMDFYVNTLNLDIVMARPFNLFGQGISPKLFIGRVYEEINKIKKGESKEILLGNLESGRDYISIEDAVKHYVVIMKKGKKGEIYNVGNGTPTKSKDILREILKKENIDMGVVKNNRRNVQANDSDQIYADISKLKKLYND